MAEKVTTWTRFGRSAEEASSGLRGEYEVLSVEKVGRYKHAKGMNVYRVKVTKLPIGVGKGKRMPGPGEDWR